MQDLINSLLQSITHKNWYSTLALSLILPDICGSLEFRKTGSENRYVEWYDKHLLKTYTREVGVSRARHVFLEGLDLYALRCKFLHEGSNVTITTSKNNLVNRFHFIVPPASGSIHLNDFDGILQLQIDKFGEEVAGAVQKWWNSLNPDIQTTYNNELLLLHTSVNI